MFRPELLEESSKPGGTGERGGDEEEIGHEDWRVVGVCARRQMAPRWTGAFGGVSHHAQNLGYHPTHMTL